MSAEKFDSMSLDGERIILCLSKTQAPYVPRRPTDALLWYRIRVINGVCGSR